MKKIIKGKKYDTDTARLVGEYYNGHMPRDFFKKLKIRVCDADEYDTLHVLEV